MKGFKYMVIVFWLLVLGIISKGQNYQTTIVHTPNGTAVNAFELVSGDYNNKQKEEIKNYWLNY